MVLRGGVALYISRIDPDAASRLLERIDTTLARLADHPHLGRPNGTRHRALRRFTVQPYILFYQPLADGIRLVRVLHGARNTAAILGDD